MQRPTFIDLSAASSRAPSSVGTVRTGGHPSPRIQHYDGEVPPVLSPLDAFAAESRRLAKELETTRLAGERRMSRLPPQVITKSLSKHQANRPSCFRSLSNPSTESLPALTKPEAFAVGTNPEMNTPQQRPKSSYPRISAVPDDEQDEDHDDDEEDYAYENEVQDHRRKTHRSPERDGEFYATPREFSSGQPQDYFGVERSISPSHISAKDTPRDIANLRPFSSLAPPNAPFAKVRPYQESSDDDYTSSNAGSTFSAPPRKSSNGSAMSYNTSPALHAQHGRTPSNKSEVSISSLSRVQQSMNYSRPLSQASSHRRTDSPTNMLSPWLERKPSHLSEKSPNHNSFDDNRSVMSDGFVSRPSSSYTHKKFVLPRGKLSEKASQRVSQLFAGLSGPTFGWQEPVFPGTPPLSARTDNGFFDHVTSPTFRPSFDPGRPSLDPGRPNFDPNHANVRPGLSRSQTAIEDGGFTFGFEQRSREEKQDERPSSSRTAPEPDLESKDPPVHKPFALQNASSFDRSKMPALPPIPGSTADDMSVKSSLATRSERSASTVRPTTARSQSDYQTFTPEEHVDKAIELHQNGNLKESTYHLRIAAKANNPTGMLLYALACRHGWGMRANPKEGVALLRRAVDIAMIEVAEDEESGTAARADLQQQRSHRAQFALAIYELGISHLNGWGVEQDKALALRCFEIAGSWGDADALTEAGFCYAEGIGCKKNLKRAAKFYRMAAEKGVSMVGNSWIYKDKYNDDEDRKSRTRKSSTAEKEKKPRDKSRTRSIFGRKRGTTVSDKDKPSQPRAE